MKKILLFLTLALTFTLVACGEEEVIVPLEYSDFQDHQETEMDVVIQPETEEYFVYMYDSSSDSDEMKSSVLGFLQNVQTVPFYIMDLETVEYNDEFGTITDPTMLVFVNGSLKEKYSGVDLLEEFIKRYGNVDDTDYKHFISSTVYSYRELESMDHEKYIAYYYSDSCSHCQEVKSDILNFLKDFDEMPYYFLDVAEAPDQTSTTIFRGTPTLFVIENNTIIEVYVGSVEVREFIELYSD